MRSVTPIALPARLPRGYQARWRWHTLFEAPHRLAFAAAALLLAASALWWAALQLAREAGFTVHSALPPSIVHGLVMGLGFMPLFFTGFMFTAGPRWLAVAPVAAGRLLPAITAQLAGWGVFMLAAHGRDAAFGATLGALGLAAVACGWCMNWLAFRRLLRVSAVADKLHAQLLLAAGLFGLVALGLAAAGLAAAWYGLVRGATLAALWGYVGLGFVSVLHRMIPFFSAAAVPLLDAWRPRWLLWSLVGTVGFEALAAIVDAGLPELPAAWRGLQGGVELLLGLGLLALALRWGLVQSLRMRLLAMLHLGFTWLGLALLLTGASHALGVASAGAITLGLAPLHAYTMGFLGSTLVAMVTRVSCGHGGRALVADDFAWRLFWVLQLATLLRVGAAILVFFVASELAQALIASAAVGWGGVCLAWALRYGHWYGTPRADGRPG